MKHAIQRHINWKIKLAKLLVMEILDANDVNERVSIELNQGRSPPPLMK